MTHLDRRTFLARLGASVAAAALPSIACVGRHPGAGARSAVAPASSASPRAIGLQLYTVRAAMQQNVADTLARVARIGYREVEFAGYFGLAPQRIRSLLDDVGLTAPASHLQSPLLGEDWPSLLEAAHVIGHAYLFVPWLDMARYPTADHWRRFAQLLNRAAAEAARGGIRVGYHTHDFAFRHFPGSTDTPFHVLVAESDAALVPLELDVYWAVRAGQDPIALLEQHPGRFHAVHAKDSAGPPDHRMVDVGDGTIDFHRILAEHAPRAGIRHVFVEHDDPVDPWRTVERSLEGVRKAWG